MSAHLAVQPVFCGELCAESAAELWDVEGLKAIANEGVIREFFLREDGAIFVRWHGREPGSTIFRLLNLIRLGAGRYPSAFELLGLFSILAPFLASAGHLSLVLSDLNVQALLERGDQVLTGRGVMGLDPFPGTKPKTKVLK